MWRVDNGGARGKPGKELESYAIIQKIDADGWDRVSTVKVVRKVRLGQGIVIKSQGRLQISDRNN